MVVDIGALEASPTDLLPGFTEQLIALLPGLHDHQCSRGHDGGFVERLVEGTWAGHVAEHVALELQRTAGHEMTRGKTRSTGERGVYNVIFGYLDETVATLAGRLAVKLVNHLVSVVDAESDVDGAVPVDLDFDFTAEHEAFLRTSQRVAFGPSTQAILEEAIARDITTRWTPDEAKIITFDFRRGMLGAVTTPHQIGYVMNSVNAPDVVGNIVAALRDRLTGIQVDPALGEVPTWSGPRLFLLLDDYDLIASSAGNQMPSIVEFLPQARDIGLHVVLARSAGGAGQGMYETVMRNLRDMGTPGILLSGSKDEGAVLGSQKMEPLPPGRGRLVHRRLGSVLVQTAKATD